MPLDLGRTEPSDIERAERQYKALKLRMAGATYEEIGSQLGVSRQTAWNDVNAYITNTQRVCKETAEELRFLQAQHLRKGMLGLATKFYAGDHMAAHATVRVHEALCKLYGLNAPVVVEHREGQSIVEIDAELEAMFAQIDASLQHNGNGSGPS